MFGFRPDGRQIKTLPPFFRIIPYVMHKRVDSQNATRQEIDYAPVTAYIRECKKQGRMVSLMSVIIAAYVRAVSEHPELNRFVVNKKIYKRNHICISFITLKVYDKHRVVETAVKIFCEPEDTLSIISERVNEAIARNRKLEEKNSTDKLINTLMSVPLLPVTLVNGIKLLDRYGLLPRKIIDAIPFHTSLFITNMASIKMNDIFHHLYEFATTSVFISMGKKQKKLELQKDGVVREREVIPLGIVTDERICSGVSYAMCFNVIEHYLQNPALLETPPERVIKDID